MDTSKNYNRRNEDDFEERDATLSSGQQQQQAGDADKNRNAGAGNKGANDNVTRSSDADWRDTEDAD